MSDVCCLLDACTVINLINIDEDDFLLKKIGNLDIHINDTVFNEIRINVYRRINNTLTLKTSNKESLIKLRKIIDQNLAFYRSKKDNNSSLLKDLGANYFEKIQSITKYKKINGEFCTTAHAIYMSRLNEKKVFFYTDDVPAKRYFKPFFDYQQIGHIKDTVDLITLLFWLDDRFTESQFKNVLKELHSQYATDITLLKHSLQKFRAEKVDAKYIKSKRDIAFKLNILIQKLENLDFQNISDLKLFFENKKANNKELNQILDNFSSVFDLDSSTTEENILSKIKYTLDQINLIKIHKLYDLCSA